MGWPGAISMAVIERTDGTSETVFKGTNIDFQVGDRVTFFTAGGGGYGDPRERDPDMLRNDVTMGLVTPEAAARDYGVDVDAPAPARVAVNA